MKVPVKALSYSFSFVLSQLCKVEGRSSLATHGMPELGGL